MDKIILLITIATISFTASAQNVGIGTSTPVASALLDISSTNKGLLPPRLTFQQRNLISNPVAGLLIWCTNCSTRGEIEVYNGHNWTTINGALIDASGMVTICNQTWMKKNLDKSQYRNGDPIPKVTDPAQWAALTTGAYCYFNNDSATYSATYGKLYNWYAVNDPRGLAPEGWHIPTNDEFTELTTCLGGDYIAGNKMKDVGTIHWAHPNAATNSSGFTALPGGRRNGNGLFNDGINYEGHFWSSDTYGEFNVPGIYLRYNVSEVFRGVYTEKVGISVRCVRD